MPITPVRRATAAALALALAGVAGTALAAGVEFRWKDLDVTTAAGKAEFDRRVDVAAREICSQRTMTGSRIARAQESCAAEVRNEIVQKVAARTGQPLVALAPAAPDNRQ